MNKALRWQIVLLVKILVKALYILSSEIVDRERLTLLGKLMRFSPSVAECTHAPLSLC